MNQVVTHFVKTEKEVTMGQRSFKAVLGMISFGYHQLGLQLCHTWIIQADPRMTQLQPKLVIFKGQRIGHKP